MRTIALVRALPRSFAAQALRTDGAKVIDQQRAEDQHRAYVVALQSILGKSNLIQLKQVDELPDSCFVEDTVVVVRPHKQAIGLHMGATAREAESATLRETLTKLGFTIHSSKSIHEKLDGGDVLFNGHKYIVGLSKRTTPFGAKRFSHYISQLDPSKEVDFIKVPHGLHLKSICSLCAPNTIVAWGGAGGEFLDDLRKKNEGLSIVEVPDEAAANVLYIRKLDESQISHHLVIREDYPVSAQILLKEATAAGITNILQCDMSELAKADGALTCCSVLCDI